MILAMTHTFQNGTGPSNIIDATEMNQNFTDIVTVLNGNIEKDNVKVGSAICLNDVAMQITAAWTFATNPIFNAGGIADSYLTTNIPKKNASNTYSALQTFGAGIDLDKTEAKNLVVELVASLPGWVAGDKGRMLYCTGDNKFYGGGGSAWEQLNYIGGYTGGAIRCYTQESECDDGNGFKLYFKVDSASPTVKIAIKGEEYPKRHYTELPYHTHTFTANTHTHVLTDAGHTHSTTIGSHTHGGSYGLSTHTHGISGSTGNQSVGHQHDLNTGVATGVADANGAHLHAKGTLAGSIGSHTHGVGSYVSGNQDTSHTHTISGGVAGTQTGTGTTSHGHAVGTLANAIQSVSHSHSFTGTSGTGGASTVPITGDTATAVNHTHNLSGITDNQNASHSHTISLTSGTPSASQSIPSTDLGAKASANSVTGATNQNTVVTGTNSNSGVSIGSGLSTTQKLYAKNLTVKIDATDITSDILTATGWGGIGNGLGSHAFHTAGSGELDASAWVSWSAGFHTLEILEPEAGFGCRVMIHIETS